MSTFYQYTARNRSGEFISGCVNAESRTKLIHELSYRKLSVTSIRAGGGLSFGVLLSWIGPSEFAKIQAIRTLSILLACGVSARNALEQCKKQSKNARLRESLAAVTADIESGSSFASALARRPRDFDQVGVSMLEAGERSGVLTETLSRYADLLERKRCLKAKLYASATYPAILALVMAVVICVLSLSVVPSFAAMFAEMHVPIPPGIHLFLKLGAVLHSPFLMTLTATTIVAMIIGWNRISKLVQVRQKSDTVLLSMPVLGKIIHLLEHERVSRTLGNLLSSGVPIPESLLAVRDIASTFKLKDAIATVAREIEGGVSMAQAVRDATSFDELFISACETGDETGRLDDLLLKIADHYAFEIETTLGQATALVEPIMIIALGSFIGFVVISLIVPLYTMIGNIR